MNLSRPQNARDDVAAEVLARVEELRLKNRVVSESLMRTVSDWEKWLIGKEAILAELEQPAEKWKWIVNLSRDFGGPTNIRNSMLPDCPVRSLQFQFTAIPSASSWCRIIRSTAAQFTLRCTALDRL